MTLDWNQTDIDICKKYDEKVKTRNMGYRVVNLKDT